MKDILVEFTDHGAIIHKAPSVIEAKKDLPYCFLNPDLSNVGGVSPSYWVYNEEGQIVMASPEERKRRDEYHENKPPENTVSFKQTMDDLLDEVYQELEKNVDDLQCVNEQIINTFESKIIQLENDIIKNKNHTLEVKNSSIEIINKISEQEKHIKLLKIGLIVNVILTIILKVI